MTADETETYTLTKRAVARDQINASVYQLFIYRNYVAVNTLALAAADVLEGLAQSAGKRTMFTEFYDLIKPEYVKDARKLVKETYNFSKHADRDPYDSLAGFRPITAVMNAWMAVVSYGVNFNQRTPEMYVLYGWFVAMKPNLVNSEFSSQIEWAKATFAGDSDMEIAKRHCLELTSNRAAFATQMAGGSPLVEI